MNNWSAELRGAFAKAQKSGLTMTAFTEAVKRETRGVRGDSESSLRDYLNGRVANPRSEILIAMSRVLGVNEQFVLQGTGDPTPAEGVVREAAGEPTLWVDDDRGWRDEAVAEIKKSSLLANCPTTVVRTGFFDLLMQVTTSPACGLDENVESMAEAASVLDDLILQPIGMFYPKESPAMSAEPVRSYLTGILHSLTLLVPRDDKGGRFGLPGKPALDVQDIIEVLLSRDDAWDANVPLGEEGRGVALRELDKEGVKELAKMCFQLSTDLGKAALRLERAAVAMNQEQCLRDSSLSATDLELLSEVAPALASDSDQKQRARRRDTELERVRTLLKEWAGDRPVLAFFEEGLSKARERLKESQEGEEE